MLTLSKVVVEVGNRSDAARAGDYRLELAAAPEAFARSEYQLAEPGLERRSERASSSLRLGADDALSQYGLHREQAIERDDLIAVLQGQHVHTGEQLRRPGVLRREGRDEHGQAIVDEEGRPVLERVTGVAHVEMTVRLPGLRVAADLLERDFRPTGPNQTWAADITYISTWEGFLYLAHVQDLFSRLIVGWSMADHLRSELVVDALEMALGRRRPVCGLVHHSDQGSQGGFNRSSQRSTLEALRWAGRFRLGSVLVVR
jgi:hypothetical protein